MRMAARASLRPAGLGLAAGAAIAVVDRQAAGGEGSKKMSARAPAASADVESGRQVSGGDAALPPPARGSPSAPDGGEEERRLSPEGPPDEGFEGVEGEEEEDAYYSKIEAANAVASLAEVPTLMATLLKICLITILTLLPAIIIWRTGSFARYDFTKVKGSLGTNPQMEFVRASLVAWFAMATFLAIEWAVGALPVGALDVLAAMRVPVTVHTRRTASNVIRTRVWLTILAWILTLGYIGSQYVYETRFVDTILAGLLATAPKHAASSAVDAIGTVKTKWYYVEGVILIVVVYSLLHAAEKYVIENVGIHFHRRAFGERIAEANYRTQMITRLYEAAKHRRGQVVLKKQHRYLHLARDPKGYFASAGRAASLGEALFALLAPAGLSSQADFITIDSLQPYFSHAADLERAFAVFDASAHGDVGAGDMAKVVGALSEERRNIARSVANNQKIVNKLDSLLFGLALTASIVYGAPSLGLGASAIFTIFGLLWAAIGFVFQNAAKNCFESLVFVFFEHAFDCGDQVLVNGERLIVERIEFFTTTFRRWDGVALYMSNAVLSRMDIVNLRRSGPQRDAIDVLLSGDATVEAVWGLRDKLRAFVRGEKGDFTGELDIEAFSIADGKAKVTLAVEYCENFQDVASRTARRNKFMAMLKQTAADAKLECFQ